MSTVTIAPEAIEDAFARLGSFMALNGGERPQGDAFAAMDAFCQSAGLDAEGRGLVLRRYREMNPGQRRHAGPILVGFVLGLLARQEADAPPTGRDVPDFVPAEWHEDS